MTAFALALALALGAEPATAAASSPGSTSTPAPADPGARYEAAAARYLAGDHDGAARAWRTLVDEGWESPALHLALGNALARSGVRGQAMASWLRGLRLDPQDADLRANLEAARAQNVDRLVGAAEPSLGARLVERTPDGVALGLFGLGWVALWALLWLRGRAARRDRGAFGLAALVAALLAAGAGGLTALKAIDRRTPVAVVVTPAAPVREGPSRTLKAAFELHEGTVLRVVEARGDLARVRLDNGLTGWVASSDLEVL